MVVAYVSGGDCWDASFLEGLLGQLDSESLDSLAELKGILRHCVSHDGEHGKTLFAINALNKTSSCRDNRNYSSARDTILCQRGPSG